MFQAPFIYVKRKEIFSEENMKAIVIYKSKTGFTEKYAGWIGEELQCEVKDLKDLDLKEISEYDLVIFGGWIRVSRIKGLKKIKKAPVKKLMVFGVGFTEDINYVDTIRKVNQLEGIPCYFMRGGFHPDKMGFFYRLLVAPIIKRPVTEMDYSDKRLIRPLVFYARKLLK